MQSSELQMETLQEFWQKSHGHPQFDQPNFAIFVIFHTNVCHNVKNLPEKRTNFTLHIQNVTIYLSYDIVFFSKQGLCLLPWSQLKEALPVLLS